MRLVNYNASSSSRPSARPKIMTARGEEINVAALVQDLGTMIDEARKQETVKKVRDRARKRSKIDPTENPTLNAQTRNALGQDDALSC